VSVVAAETAFAPSAADASNIHLNPRRHSLPCGPEKAAGGQSSIVKDRG
jgi:hypothetical protein